MAEKTRFTTFREIVRASRLAQHDIARMLNRSRKTVNRWCRHGAPEWAVELLQSKLTGAKLGGQADG